MWKAKERGTGQRYIEVAKPTLRHQQDENYEDEFQKWEMQNMRRHIQDLFTHMLPKPRIIGDVAGKRKGPITCSPRRCGRGGPAWQDLPGIARPDLPTSAHATHNKARIEDFCLTDYKSAVWQQMFGDCPSAVNGGKG